VTSNPEERLHARTLGSAGPRVVFVHGLFGQGKNWTTIAKGLAADHRVTLLDLPNHGHSPWTDRVDYVDMAELVAAELGSFGEPVTLVGHSMGGKVSMQLALRHPELLRALVVVDIAPVEYPVSGGRTDDPDEEASPFAAYIAAMRALYDGPVLWIAGATSHYVLPGDRARMEELFPNTRLVRVKNAGHWVHSEQPEVFLQTVRLFLDAVE
jgi:pimeloyl-ACP methyl ester carboxylesterase